MNLQDIAKSIAQQKQREGKGMYNQAHIMNQPTGNLKRHEMKKLGTFVWIIPKQLQLPFNPMDLEDTYFTTQNPYIVPSTVSKAILGLKQVMRVNPELHKYCATLGGITVDAYDVSEDIVTDLDFKIFNPFTAPLQLSMTTQTYKFADFGTWGTERLSLIEYDEDREVTDESKGLLSYQLLELERAIVDEKIAEFLVGKDVSKLSKDVKDQLATIRRSSQVGWPRLSGICLFLEYEADTNKEELLPIENPADLESRLSYINCSGDLLKLLDNRIGKRSDTNIDYLELKVTYGDGKPTSDMTEELSLYNSRNFEFPAFDELKVTSAIEDFNTKFIELVDKGLAGAFEALAKRNVFKFRHLSDGALLTAAHGRMKEIEKYITQDIYNDHISLIEKCNLDVADRLRDLAATKSLPNSFKKVKEGTIRQIGNTTEITIPEEDAEESGFEGQMADESALQDLAAGVIEG